MAVILLVDDDADIREAFALALEEQGYRVLLAEDGEDALEKLALAKGEAPSIILLDLMMPRMSGVEFRARQMMHDELRHIPTIVVSASADLGGQQLQGVQVLRKPVGYLDLVDAIERALRSP